MSTKDYYSILGIRPAASVQEIELAYKGRRSQYHPDKYAQLDQETVKWATSNMQEINEAFTVLSDVIRRRTYDASYKKGTNQSSTGTKNKSESHHRSSDPRRNTESDTRKQSVPAKLTLKDYVLLCGVTMISSTRIFFAPNIPTNKLDGAMARYGLGLDRSDVVILIDDTVFGGAKEGALITRLEMRVQEKGESVRCIGFDQIQSIRSAGNAIFLNESQRVAQLLLQEQLELSYVVSVVDEYLALSRRMPLSAGCDEHARLRPHVIEDICKKHLFNTPAENRANYYMGDAIGFDMMRTVRFSLSIAEDEQVIAVCNLALHTKFGHEAFVVTSLGLYSKCQGISAFFSWTRLQSMSICGEYVQSVYCGVVLGGQQTILCSRLRGDNQTFGASLIANLIVAAQ